MSNKRKYDLPVEEMDDDKAKKIKIHSFKRPHMRNFHFSWMSFFLAFLVWFSFAPLMSEIKATLKLSKNDVWYSNIASVAGTVTARIIIGPLLDQYGPKRAQVISFKSLHPKKSLLKK